MPQAADHWRFVPKHRWEVKNNPISGMCLFAWLELVWTRRYDIEWSAYWLRVAFLSVITSVNSVLATVEWLLYGRAIARVKLDDCPLFVIGHPRTGTTLMHTLLALDDAVFTTPTTFCVGFPSTFLWFERFKGVFVSVVDSKRPMDGMPLSLDTVQVGKYFCKDSAAPAGARTHAHRPATPRQGPGVAQTPHIMAHGRDQELRTDQARM